MGRLVLSKNIKEILTAEIDPEEFGVTLGKTASRRKQIASVCIWFCAITCLLLITHQTLLSFNFGYQHKLTDYGSLYASAYLANLHDNPYRDNFLVYRIEGIDRHGPSTPLQGKSVNAINLNPPVVLYPFRLLARLTPDLSFIVWVSISVALLIASVLLILKMYPAHGLRIRILWILATGAVWYTFYLGQIYMVLLFFGSIAWWALRKQRWLVSGISIGVICAMKPNFLVWPGLLIVGKSKKIGFTAFATTGLLSALPLFLQGPVIYRQWLDACRGYNGYELPGNASLVAICSRAGIPQVGLVLTVLLLAATTLWIFIAKPDSRYTSEIGILAALIAGPISWLGYTILLIPVMYGKALNTASRIGCVLLCIPVWVAMPHPHTSRLAYILLWAPNMYAIGLLAYSAVRAGVYREAYEGVPERGQKFQAVEKNFGRIPLETHWKFQSFVPSKN
jgi:hypothetical protein